MEAKTLFLRLKRSLGPAIWQRILYGDKLHHVKSFFSSTVRSGGKFRFRDIRRPAKNVGFIK